MSLTYRTSLAAAALLWGCRGSVPDTGPVLSHDSAGVHLVENVRPLWNQSEGWRVSPEPALQVGSTGQDTSYRLRGVTDAMRLADGSIIVANGGTSELKVFDSAGLFLRSIGGMGKGPGQFGLSTIRLWWGPASELIASDGGNDRVNVFDSTGAFLRSVPIEPSAELVRPELSGVFGDSTWLVVGSGEAFRAKPGTVVTNTLRCLRYGPNGAPRGVLRQLDDQPRYVDATNPIGNYPFLPLSGVPLFAPAVDRLLVMSVGKPELNEFGLDGSLKRIVRWNIPRRRASEVYERYKTAYLAAFPDAGERARYERYYQLQLPLPEFVPSYQRMLVDSRSNVWLERYRLPDETQPDWDIIDPEGRWLGTVDTPTGVQMVRVGEDYVLGKQQDSLGVEHVRLHGLKRTR